jgi:type I restriction enzyme S subunit
MKVLKVNYKDIHKVRRLDSSYHLSEGIIYLKKLRAMPHAELQNLSSRIFTAGRNKRVYTNKDFGFPYLSNSDVSNLNPFSDCKYNSKKYAFDKNSFLKEGMIVTGRVGAIGQTSYITAEFEEKRAMGSDNIIRIVPSDFNLSGYIYAFLASKFGKTLLWQLATGGVQPYISEEMLFDLPIPRIDRKKEKDIHEMIIEASKLKVEANKILFEAQEEINNKVQFKKDTFEQQNITPHIISASHLKRFEAQYFKSEGSKIIKHIEVNIKYKYLKDVSEPIFRPGIFKRHYVNEGIEFLGGSDIVKAIPSSEKKLSKSKTSHLDSMIIKENWILVTCGGTIGYSVLVDRMTAGKAASQHILRVIPKNIPQGYVYAFMSSEIGLKAIQSFTYGSVIPQIESHHLELLPIPILEDEEMNRIHQKVMKYKDKIGTAIENELKAIDLIEKEIESWQ